MIKKIFALSTSEIINNKKLQVESIKSFKKAQKTNNENHTRISNDIKNFKYNPKSLKKKNKHIFNN